MDTTDATEPEIPVATTPSRIGRIVRRALVAMLALAIAGGIGGVILLIVLAKDLPEIRTLADYRPHQATVVYGSDGRVTARFAKERRTVVPFERIPKMMIHAVLAAEDDQFFEHEGVDYVGIARCAVKNVLSGRKKCGGSTITQQTVKTFFLTKEKTYTRKLREMILAKRIEEALEKNDILYLYLNQIYYGHRAYGVQEAAKVYFGKDVSEIDVAEAALLAGLPQQPSRLDPYRHPDRALKRRAYVLRRMKELERIDAATYDAAMKAPLDLVEDRGALDSNSYYAAHVRAELEEKLGDRRVESGGLTVYAGIDPVLQKSAEKALENGLRDLDKRQGWRGPILHLERDELRELERLLGERYKKRVASSTVTKVWDLGATEDQSTPVPIDQIVGRSRFVPLAKDGIYAGPVVEVDDPGKAATVRLAPKLTVTLPLRTGLSWARKFDIHRYTRRPSAPSDVLAVGDLVHVRVTGKKKDGTWLAKLEQTPKVQGAVVSIDPATREVRAMVGGLGVGAGTFNRAVQARRQAGSTFKPFVYAAAFDTEKYSPVSICQDEPRVYRDPWTGRSWKPQNYGKKFDGDITLRTALTRSKNLCSVELIDKLGVDPVLDMARRAGVKSPLPKNLTLALGSGDVTPLEMANAYATLADGGRYAEPIFVRLAKSPDGKALVSQQAAPKQTIRPAIAYLITSLMQSVVEDGTAQRVKVLERPIAGKTGTTNEARNAWFIGFAPDLVTAVWVGFDNNDPLGPYETGGRAAIPIWVDVMRTAFERSAPRDFTAPSDVVFAVVDPATGKLVAPDNEGAKTEPFLDGTQPTEFAEEGGESDQLIWEDYER